MKSRAIFLQILALFGFWLSPWQFAGADQAKSPPAPAASSNPATAAPEVLVVFVFDNSCKAACPKVRPILKELQTEFGDRIQVIEIDKSPEKLADSKKYAASFGLCRFLENGSDWVPIVGIFTGNIKDKKPFKFKELQGTKVKDAYEEALKKALRSNER